MKYVVWLLLIVLLILHQDYWNWDKQELVFGFMPHSLAYHCGISVVASVVWAIVVFFGWPTEQLQMENQKGADE